MLCSIINHWGRPAASSVICAGCSLAEAETVAASQYKLQAEQLQLVVQQAAAEQVRWVPAAHAGAGKRFNIRTQTAASRAYWPVYQVAPCIKLPRSPLTVDMLNGLSHFVLLWFGALITTRPPQESPPTAAVSLIVSFVVA